MGCAITHLRLPWTPAFLHKRGGMVLSIGQFNQWVANQLMGAGTGADLAGDAGRGPLFVEEESGRKLAGVRLADQGVQATAASRLRDSSREWMCVRC